MIVVTPSESTPRHLTPLPEKSFTKRLFQSMIQYAVFAGIGMVTVLAVLWKQAQPASVGVAQNVLVSVITDVLMVPAFIIVMALSKSLLVWVNDQWHYETVEERIASHKKMQRDLILSGLIAFAAWLTFLTTGGEQPRSHGRGVR